MSVESEIKDVFTLDDLCKILGLKPMEDWEFDADFSDYRSFGDACYDEYLAEHAEDSESFTGEIALAAREYAEEKVLAAVNEEEREIYRKIQGASLSAIETFFEYLDLDLISKDKNDWEFEVKPATSWEASLKELIQLINGYGMFHYSGAPEFLEVNCYENAREAVLDNLVYLKHYGEVYGGGSPSAFVDRNLR